MTLPNHRYLPPLIVQFGLRGVLTTLSRYCADIATQLLLAIHCIDMSISDVNSQQIGSCQQEPVRVCWQKTTGYITV